VKAHIGKKEINSLFFTWTAAFLALLVINFNDFLGLFLLLFMRSLVYFMYTRVVPLYAF
jgi:hypothetical protein